MTKICTSIEQSQKLIELGIDINTADMYWEEKINLPNVVVGNYALHIQCRATDKDYKKLTNPVLSPAWSLTALLELVPNDVSLLHFEDAYQAVYDVRPYYITNKSDNPLDAVFEMVCWLKENNKL